MYSKHRNAVRLSFYIMFVACILIGYFVAARQEDIKEWHSFINNMVTNIVTFISICFGFYLTSLSILFSSDYIKSLNAEDAQKPTQRQIHTLQKYFKLAIYCSLQTIIAALSILLLAFLFPNKHIIIISTSFLISIFMKNFIFIHLLLKVFMNAFIVQARPNK